MMNDAIETTGNAPTTHDDEAAKLVTKGNQLLLRAAKPADAAGSFSQALQLAPKLVSAHLGMAEANLALGTDAIARSAATYVKQLAPGTIDADLAQAILFTMDRHFPEALDQVEQVTRAEPGQAYAHALRGYILRSLGNDYDARLAEAKASRLASAPDLRGLFPHAVPVAATTLTPSFTPAGANGMPSPSAAPRADTPQWSPPSPARRRAVQTSFALRGMPIATYSIIAICLIVFGIQMLTSIGGDPTSSPLAINGAEFGPALQQGQWYRILTAMFLHESILHILFNMFSLWSIGSIVERLYGAPRFLLIYFVSGIAGGLLLYAIAPNEAAVGASGAIFGIFGAFGAFFFVFRNRLGPVANSMLQQWGFFLVLNVVFSLQPGIAWQDHLGGIVMGIILGIVLLPQRR